MVRRSESGGTTGKSRGSAFGVRRRDNKMDRPPFGVGWRARTVRLSGVRDPLTRMDSCVAGVRSQMAAASARADRCSSQWAGLRPSRARRSECCDTVVRRLTRRSDSGDTIARSPGPAFEVRWRGLPVAWPALGLRWRGLPVAWPGVRTPVARSSDRRAGVRTPVTQFSGRLPSVRTQITDCARSGGRR